MGAVRLILFAEARHRWRAWLALAVLVTLVTGVAMAAATAARRTTSAFPRYLATYGYDTETYSFAPTPVTRLPEVTRSVRLLVDGTGEPACAGCRPINDSDFSVIQLPGPTAPPVAKLLSGRLPRSTDEVLASFNLAAEGVHLGTVITVPFYAPSQLASVTGASTGAPKGPAVDLRVVGFEAAAFEFPSVGTPSYDLWTGPAFTERYGERVLHLDIYLVGLHRGPLVQGRFQAAALKAGALGTEDLDVAAADVQSSIEPQAAGWWVLAAVAAVAGLLAIAQAFARQIRVIAETYPALSALGIDRTELVALNIARSVAISVLGAAGGLVLAVALSPLTPVGEARTADPTAGLYADPLVLGLGALLAVVLSAVVALWPSFQSARLRRSAPPPRGSSVVVNTLAAAGAPPTAVIGVRRVLERGRGRDAVPVGTAIVGTILAVLALSATAVFGASLSHLTATPSLYGQRFDVWFSSFGPASQDQLTGPLLRDLRADPGIGAVTIGASAELVIDGHSVNTIAGKSAKGALLMTTIDGHLPSGPRQIALGETTLRQVGAHLGSLVTVTAAGASGRSRPSSFRVVGTVAFPPDFSGVGGLGNGAITTLADLAAAQCPPRAPRCVATTETADEQVLLVRAAPGRHGRAVLDGYARRYSNIVTFPSPPTDLVNFGEAVNFPLIVGVVLALFGASTLLHMLVVSTARRRSETGLLKALGFVRPQVAAAVAWQATTLGIIGVVVGIPLGIGVGDAVWRLFAHHLGVVPVTLVGAGVIVAIAAGVIVLANLLAVGPAVVSSRLRPAELLRNE